MTASTAPPAVTDRRRRNIWRRLPAALLVILMAAVLKAHYSNADSEALEWILAPTAALVSLTGSSSFVQETGTGYVRSDRRMVIAPACAGVNFMITAFLMLAFHGIFRSRNTPAPFMRIALNLLSAYVLTLLVNTARIHLSMSLYAQDFYGPWITPARVHRAAGIFIYFIFLCLCYGILERSESRGGGSSDTESKSLSGSSSLRLGIVPMIWYGLMMVIVPLLNHGIPENRPLFLEHCGMLMGMCGIVFLGLVGVRSLLKLNVINLSLFHPHPNLPPSREKGI